MKTMNFSAHIMNVFTEMKTSYDEVKNLMFDLYRGELEDGLSKRAAEDKLRELNRKIFGLTKDSSLRERKRAYEALKKHPELFAGGKNGTHTNG